MYSQPQQRRVPTVPTTRMQSDGAAVGKVLEHVLVLVAVVKDAGVGGWAPLRLRGVMLRVGCPGGAEGLRGPGRGGLAPRSALALGAAPLPVLVEPLQSHQPEMLQVLRPTSREHPGRDSRCRR